MLTYVLKKFMILLWYQTANNLVFGISHVNIKVTSVFWRLRSINCYGFSGHKSGPGCALWLTYSKAYKINRMTKLIIVFSKQRGKGKVETQYMKSNRCDLLEIFCHQVSSNVFHIEICNLK
jgi:hypothetical protein